jgi:hypothetical protein
MEWGYTISGFAVGLLVGLTGVGGGSLMTPLLIFLFHINPVKAVGTDLLFAAITKSAGIWVHGRKGHIELKVVGLLALGSLPTALISLSLIRNLLDSDLKALTAMVTTLMGGALILTAGAIIMRHRVNSFGESVKRFIPNWRTLRPYATVGAGVILGFLVPITSVGAGALGAAMLMFLYPSMATRNIVGTDLAHAVPLTLLAGLGHLQMGTVNLPLLLALLLGSLPGIYLGSHMSARVPERVLRALLAGMLLLIGTKLIFS